MIVATAGHVDHGKTLLVQGADRRRHRPPAGGEAPRHHDRPRLRLSAGRGRRAPIGFVDVPGHERFVRNMLGGVAGIDFALLVVAADDGLMPQTREHLAILDLLGVARGAVALTKIDRVAPSASPRSRRRSRALLAGHRARRRADLPRLRRRPATASPRCSTHLEAAARAWPAARGARQFPAGGRPQLHARGRRAGRHRHRPLRRGRGRRSGAAARRRACRCACAASMRRTRKSEIGQRRRSAARSTSPATDRRSTRSRAATGSCAGRAPPPARTPRRAAARPGRRGARRWRTGRRCMCISARPR